jgi:hypothetical protein
MSYTSFGDTTRETGSALAYVGCLVAVDKMASLFLLIVGVTTLHSTSGLGHAVIVITVNG